MEKYSPREWLNLMVSEPYYLYHFLAFFSYLIVRSSATSVLLPHRTDHLLHREAQAILAFTLLTFIKMVRQETWEAFIADMLFFAKVFLVGLAFVMDYHVALWYLGVFGVIYILTQQPTYQGLGTSYKLTPLQLEAVLTEGNTSRFWLVEFRSSCSPSCIRTSRCFPDLSITYSNTNLSFGIVDVGLFPNAAEKFGIYLGGKNDICFGNCFVLNLAGVFYINLWLSWSYSFEDYALAGGMDQLPTYILFENGAEVARIPQFNLEAKSSHPPITKRHLSRYFELDLRLLEYVNGK